MKDDAYPLRTAIGTRRDLWIPVQRAAAVIGADPGRIGSNRIDVGEPPILSLVLS
jgi:hypothetical protein